MSRRRAPGHPGDRERRRRGLPRRRSPPTAGTSPYMDGRASSTGADRRRRRFWGYDGRSPASSIGRDGASRPWADVDLIRGHAYVVPGASAGRGSAAPCSASLVARRPRRPMLVAARRRRGDWAIASTSATASSWSSRRAQDRRSSGRTGASRSARSRRSGRDWPALPPRPAGLTPPTLGPGLSCPAAWTPARHRGGRAHQAVRVARRRRRRLADRRRGARCSASSGRTAPARPRRSR